MLSSRATLSPETVPRGAPAWRTPEGSVGWQRDIRWGGKLCRKSGKTNDETDEDADLVKHTACFQFYVQHILDCEHL